MTSLADLVGRLDHEPVQRGRRFERICRWFVIQDPVYAGKLRSDRVWFCNEPAAGLDDGALTPVSTSSPRTIDEHLWAIPAKAYDESAWITTWTTFRSESARSEYSFRLLIATIKLDRAHRPAHARQAGM